MEKRSRTVVGGPRAFLFSASVCIAAFAFGGCGQDEDPPPPPGGGSAYVACEALTARTGSAVNDVAFWAETNTYGLNTFYVWELDALASAASGYAFRGNGSPVTDRVPAKNWQIPPTLWSAIRLALDGNDPHVFSDTDPFHLWYLPYVPGPSWLSKTGATNDGTCPGGAATANGRVRCIGRNQVDASSPLLAAGKPYLVRMMMLIPLGGSENRVQSCYQTVLIR